MYQDTISLFNLSTLLDRYEMLRQLGNIFIVQPEILKTYLQESYLGRIENRLLRPFVMQRTDYNEFGRKWWDEILGEEVAGGSGGAVGKEGKGMGFAGLMKEFSAEKNGERPRSVVQ